MAGREAQKEPKRERKESEQRRSRHLACRVKSLTAPGPALPGKGRARTLFWKSATRSRFAGRNLGLYSVPIVIVVPPKPTKLKRVGCVDRGCSRTGTHFDGQIFDPWPQFAGQLMSRRDETRRPFMPQLLPTVIAYYYYIPSSPPLRGLRPRRGTVLQHRGVLRSDGLV